MKHQLIYQIVFQKFYIQDPSVLLSTILQQPHSLNTDLTTQDLTGGNIGGISDLTGGIPDLNVGGKPDQMMPLNCNIVTNAADLEKQLLSEDYSTPNINKFVLFKFIDGKKC